MSEVTTDTDNVPENQSAHSGSARESVGDLLRASRVKAGKEITTVASSLRISARYLEALEDGRNDDLPGSTYAVGFVRSYAEYLGLDEDEIVRRFKEQTSELSEKSELTFPKPIPEGGVPGGVLLLGGVVLALLAYGILYFGGDNDEQAAKMVEPVPERMAEETNEKKLSSPQGGPQAGSSVSSPATPSVAKPEPEPEAKVEATSVEEEPATTSEPEEVASEASSEAASETDEEIKTPPEATETAAVEEQAAIPAPAPTPAPAPQPEAAPAPEPAPAPAAAPKPESRIVVRAKTNSWIQVRDNVADKLLFTRLLRKGNEYSVPNRGDLTLLTGNAGALEILVDGELVPPIGETGDIRRNVQLDPEQLKSGTAVKD